MKENGSLSAYPGDRTASSELSGLTKRELIAAMVVQGLAPAWFNKDEPITDSKLADHAVRIADALLSRLDDNNVDG